MRINEKKSKDFYQLILQNEQKLKTDSFLADKLYPLKIVVNNAICSIEDINSSPILHDSQSTNEFVLFINHIGKLLESTEQIYRFLYQQNKCLFQEKENCFIDRRGIYQGLNNDDYFQEIRAMVYAHCSNLKSPDNSSKHLFADLVCCKKTFFVFNRKGYKFEFYVPVLDSMGKTIIVYINIHELVNYANQLNDRFDDFKNKLSEILLLSK